MEIEHFFICPYCWQEISVILDLSIAAQNYIEDCEVCCRPMQIFCAAKNSDLIDFQAKTVEQ